VGGEALAHGLQNGDDVTLEFLVGVVTAVHRRVGPGAKA
jgi:hypothetical protein